MKVHDFLDTELGKAIPYGVYDISENQGWVSVGIDHDTARFAAGAIARWWRRKMGSKRYGNARELPCLSVDWQLFSGFSWIMRAAP